jgi:hypothetical protein
LGFRRRNSLRDKKPHDGKSVKGQSRHFGLLPATSGLPRTTDISGPAPLVRFVPMCDIARDHRLRRSVLWRSLSVPDGLDFFDLHQGSVSSLSTYRTGAETRIWQTSRQS